MEKCENFENIHRFLAAKNHHEFAKTKKTKIRNRNPNVVTRHYPGHVPSIPVCIQYPTGAPFKYNMCVADNSETENLME